MNNRPHVYIYRGAQYNTFSTYVFGGEYPESQIKLFIGTDPYVKRVMRIRYSNGVYYWRNVIINLRNGYYYVISPSSGIAGTVPVDKPVIFNIPMNNGTRNSTRPGSSTGGATTLSADAVEDDMVEVLQSTSTTTSSTAVVIETAPASALPTNDAENQNALKEADAATQDQLATITVPVYASASKIVGSLMALAVTMLVTMFIL